MRPKKVFRCLTLDCMLVIKDEKELGDPMSTKITDVFPEKILVRGIDVCELAEKITFGDVIYLLAKGVLPKENEGRLIEAMLVCCCDHGIDAPSTFIARATISCGVPLQAAIAAGINAIGDYHGGAGEALAKALQEFMLLYPQMSIEDLANQVIGYFVNQSMRVPGFGHRQHNPDPRALKLIEMSRNWGLSGKYTDLVEKISEILRASRSSKLHVNVDGAIAALISDLGLHWRFAKSIFIIARVAGLNAHVIEELEIGQPLGFIKSAQTTGNEGV